jgi:diacylglycerol kinase family enzyme
VNGRTFVNNSSIGVYPDIVVERESSGSRATASGRRFALATARILRRYRGLVVRLTTADTAGARAHRVSLRRQQRLRDRGPRPRRAGDARRRPAGAYLAPRVHARDLPTLLARALAGRMSEAHVLESFVTDELHVHTPGRRRLHVAPRRRGRP